MREKAHRLRCEPRRTSLMLPAPSKVPGWQARERLNNFSLGCNYPGGKVRRDRGSTRRRSYESERHFRLRSVTTEIIPKIQVPRSLGKKRQADLALPCAQPVHVDQHTPPEHHRYRSSGVTGDAGTATEISRSSRRVGASHCAHRWGRWLMPRKRKAYSRRVLFEPLGFGPTEWTEGGTARLAQIRACGFYRAICSSLASSCLRAVHGMAIRSFQPSG